MAYLWSPGPARESWETLQVIPWGLDTCGGLVPKGFVTEGRASIKHEARWTAVAFPDRTLDTEKGSSTFVVETPSPLSVDQVMVLARKYFPEVVGRFTFAVVEA
jgi:hypothetical protein